MTKKIFFSILLLLFICCSKDTQQNNDEEIKEIKGTSPVITISEFDDLIETTTRFNVQISGTDDETTTTVLLNDSEVVSTNQKEFEFKINPFDFSNGQKKLVVKSSTLNNEETVETNEIEIKKLLFRSYSGFSSESVDSYLAINLQSTGELVAFKKIINYDDPIFFHAEDNFIEEDIIVTQYLIGANSGFHLAKMYGNVRPGTELMSTLEMAKKHNLDFVSSRNESLFNVTIDGTLNYNLFSLLSRNYNFGNSNFPELEIKYDESLTKDVFLFYLNQSNENILNNYRYIHIKNLQNQIIKFDELSTTKPDDIHTMDVPENVENVRISLFGFTSEKDYREDYFRLLFLNGFKTEESDYSINYPLIHEYPINVKIIGLDFKDGSQMIFEQKGTPDLTTPNLTIEKNENEIQINGEYDFSTLHLNITNVEGENNQLFRMIYKNHGVKQIKIPFESFEIPEEIIQILTEKGLGIKTENNSGELELRISNYENKVFPNGVFHFTLRREYGDAFHWTIPLN